LYLHGSYSIGRFFGIELLNIIPKLLKLQILTINGTKINYPISLSIL